MAIYGAGSKWDDELKQKFFKDETYVIGWDAVNAKDLYEALAHLKVGDIIYLKANKPGSRDIRVKGIGIVKKSVIQCINDNEYGNTEISDWKSFFVKVKWIYTDEFHISIPDNEGRLTNVRSATFYEEFLPCVQNEILSKVINA